MKTETRDDSGTLKRKCGIQERKRGKERQTLQHKNSQGKLQFHCDERSIEDG